MCKNEKRENVKYKMPKKKNVDNTELGRVAVKYYCSVINENKNDVNDVIH